MKSLKEPEEEDLQVLAARQVQELTSLQNQGLCYLDYNIGHYRGLGLPGTLTLEGASCHCFPCLLPPFWAAKYCGKRKA